MPTATKKPIVKKSTTVAKKSVKKTATVAKKPVKKSTAAAKKPVKKTTAIAKKPVKKTTAVAKKPTVKKTTVKRKTGGGFMDAFKRTPVTTQVPTPTVHSAVNAAYPTADARQQFLQNLPTDTRPVPRSKPDAMSNSMKLAEEMQQRLQATPNRRFM